MAAEAIGAVRIDFFANLTGFSKSIKNVNETLSHTRKVMDNAARSFSKTVQDIERGSKVFDRAGKDLTKGLTLPIAAFAAAAIKASDPAGHFTEKLKDMGIEALVTLQPIGNALISAFEVFEPTIRRAISVVGVLAEKFSQLSPETQRMIIIAGAAAAAIGPLMVAGAGLVKVATLAGGALAKLVSVAKVFTFVVSPPMLVAIAAIAGALVGLELGTYFYDEFKIVQTTAAATINLVENGWEYLSSSFKIAVAAIRGAWDAAMDFVLERNADVIDKVAAGLRYVKVISKEQLAEVTTLTTKMRAVSGDFDFKAEYAKIIAARNANIAFNDAVYQMTVEQIDRDFAGQDRKGQTFMDHLGGGLSLLGDQIGPVLQPLKDKFGAFLADVDRYAATSQDRAAAWKRDAEGAKNLTKATDDVNKALERMRDEAMRIRFEVYPQEKLDADIARIHELATAFPEILDGPTVQAAIEKLTKGAEKPIRAIRTWRDEFRDMFRDFGRDASRTFAQIATGAKVSFKEIALSWVQMAIEMAAQQWIFGPAFNAIGTILFGPPAASAMGNIFSRGEIVPHFNGGVVQRESYFPMRRGIGSMAEGNKPEAIMPLTRLNGRLGVLAGGGGGGNIVQIFDQRSGGEAVQTSESRGPNGERLLRVLIRDEVGQMAGDGAMDRILGSTYGTRRRPRTR